MALFLRGPRSINMATLAGQHAGCNVGGLNVLNRNENGPLVFGGNHTGGDVGLSFFLSPKKKGTSTGNQSLQRELSGTCPAHLQG